MKSNEIKYNKIPQTQIFTQLKGKMKEDEAIYKEDKEGKRINLKKKK